MAILPKKCGIVGCGQVGSSIAFTLLQHGIFSELVLMDKNKKKADGEAHDLNHGIAYAYPCRIISGGYAELSDCGIIILTAGANQKPGESRMDLVSRNARIMREIVPQITAVNSECILLVVTNPVDIMTAIVQRVSGFPPKRVIGSGTVLDTARLKYLLGQHLCVATKNIHGFVIGEHGDSELAVWSSANVSGIDLEGFCKNCEKNCSIEALHDLFDEVKNSANRIIAAKGATYYGIALAVLRICQAMVQDENAVLTVSALAGGQYGISGTYLGLPCIIGSTGVKRILEIPLNEAEKLQLKSSAELLREVLQSTIDG